MARCSEGLWCLQHTSCSSSPSWRSTTHRPNRAVFWEGLGMVIGVVGTTLVSGVVLVEIAGASGAEVDAVLGAGLPGALALLGGLAFLLGLILFDAATMRAGVLPR